MAFSVLPMESSTNRDSNPAGWTQDQFDIEIPKFKSFAPSSLPISPSLVSPTIFSPSDFLSSPALFPNSNILASPTVGAVAGSTSKAEQSSLFDFSFQALPRTSSAPSSVFQFPSNFVSVEQQPKSQQETWSSDNSAAQNSFSAEKSEERSELPCPPPVSVQYSQSSQQARERRAEDGYNWRKYGQKQVKGSENPRSYYKCTYPNCPTKKKVERSLDGQITEIVYKGNHNHPKPQSSRRSSSSSQSIPASAFGGSEFAGQTDSFMVQDDNTSGSFGEEEFDQGSPISNLVKEEDDDDPETKRWKGSNEGEGIIGSGSRTVREPRIVVQTRSDIDILDDGYRWRKYGQKVVKGNPNPRSYYKCTTIGCPVRKHVERASHDVRAVITTYEGKHNHDVPAARGSGYAVNRPPSLPNPTSTTSVAPMPIRPSAVPGNPNYTHYFQESASRLQAPFTLQMLQNPAGDFGYSANQTQQHSMGYLSRAKEEPNDDSFFEAFLS